MIALVTVAGFYSLAGLPIAWGELTDVPSRTWTGTQYALMGAAIILGVRRVRYTDGPAQLFVLWLVSFPVFATLSYLIVESMAGGRDDVLSQTYFVITLGMTEFAFGLVMAAHLGIRPFIASLVTLAIYVSIRQERFTVKGWWETFESLEVLTNYQFAGDAIATSALIALCFVRSRVLYLIIVAVAVYGLFIVSSRSAAAIGWGSLALGVLRFSGSAVTTVGLALLIPALGAWAFLDLETVFAETRFDFLFTGETDPSASARDDSLQAGLDVIREHPITGFFAFELDRFGIAGLYVHNALDVWVQAGFLSFMLFLVACTAVLLRWVGIWRMDAERAYRLLPLMVFVFGSWALARVPYAGVVMTGFGFLVGCLADPRAAEPQPGLIKRWLSRRDEAATQPAVPGTGRAAP